MRIGPQLVPVVALAVALACHGRAQPSYPSNFAGVRLTAAKIERASDGAPYTGTLIARDGEIAEVARVVMAGTPMEKVPVKELGGLILVLPVRDGLAEGDAMMHIDLASPNLSKEVRRRIDLPSWARAAVGTVVVAEATFARGKLEGTALVNGPGGKRLIEARFRDNRLHGAAREFFPGTNQVHREVAFDTGKRTGRERTFYRDGKLEREASYLDGEVHGQVTEYFASSAVRLRAEYVRGKPVAHETWFPTGQLRSQIKHGENGVHTLEWYSNGDLKQGFGQTHPPNGLVEEYHHAGALHSRTNYVNGTRHGPFEAFYANGKKWEAGEFEQGKQIGLHRKWWKNGQLALEATYVKGVLHGSYRRFYANGTPWEAIDYTAGKKTGRYQKWWKNGAVAHQYTYVDGKLDGDGRQLYANGAKWVETRHAKGKPVGTHQRWYPNGRVGSVVAHKNGRPDGPYRRWWADGKPRLEATYVDGRFDGEYKNWLEDGTVYEVATYKAGVKIKTTRPDKTAN